MEMVSSHIFILKLASNEARTFLHVDLLLRMLQASAHQHMMIFCRFCKPWAISIIPDASDVAFAMNVWMGFRSQWISTIRSIVSTISTSELRDVSNMLHNKYYVHTFKKRLYRFRIFAPSCAKCGESITPFEGTSETVRVAALGKDFHVDCYVCEVNHLPFAILKDCNKLILSFFP